MDPERILPFELKTTLFTQAVVHLWITVLVALPFFVSKQIRIIPYLILILVLLIVFLSFFLATHESMKKDEDELL